MYPYIYIVIPTYGALALIGGFAALMCAYFRIDKLKIEFSVFLKTFLVGVVGLFLGSKILFAITQIPWLISNFSIANMILLIPRSGYVFYGGLFGFIFSVWVCTKNDPEQREKVFRLIVPSMPLFHAFGRIGCFLSGCCYGKSLGHNVRIGMFIFGRIPVQLIEAFLELVIFAVVVMVDKKKKEVNLLSVYLIMYACVRFTLEFLRGDEIRGIFLGVSTSQWISLFIVIYYITKKFRKRTAKEKIEEN